MQLVVLIIHLFLALALIGVVLMQRSEGGALGIGGGGGGGMSGFLTGRATANLLTRATAIIAALFICTSMLLAIMASSGKTTASDVINTPSPAPAAPAKPAPSKTPTKPAAPAK